MLVKNRAEKNSSKEPTKGNKTLFISISYPTSSPHCTVFTTYIFSLLRRFVQLNQCGFHGVSSRPYKDLGQVELNDGRLILDGLGQSTTQEQVLFLEYVHIMSLYVNPFREKATKNNLGNYVHNKNKLGEMSNIDAYKSEATLNSVNTVLLCDGFLIHFFSTPSRCLSKPIDPPHTVPSHHPTSHPRTR